MAVAAALEPILRLEPRASAESVPGATYRVQFGPQFGFRQAMRILPMLRELGISALYASPIFCARPGSQHGYDVVNPLRLNPELGSQEDFEHLCASLRAHGLGLILDIVPNHMAACDANPWWWDLLENGKSSSYADYFDLQAGCSTAVPGHKLVLPLLGEPYADVLEKGHLRLGLDSRGFHVSYFEKRFPIDPATYGRILNHPGELLEQVRGIPERNRCDSSSIERRRWGRMRVLTRLWQDYCGQPEFRDLIDRTLRAFNGVRGRPESFEALDRLLGEQSYALVYWREANEMVGYRRFFDVCELVALRQENPRVFQRSHALLRQLVQEGKVQGVRIDHIDGLRDPEGYLHNLASCLETANPVRPTPIFVEKVLQDGEELPVSWPVSGTTGYDFHNAVNGVFVDQRNLAALGEIYARFTGSREAFQDLVWRQKRRVIHELFAPEFEALGRDAHILATETRRGRDLGPRELTRALEEVTVFLPVYRTYIRDFSLPARDRANLEQALARAEEASAPCVRRAVAFLRGLLLLEFPETLDPETRERWLGFVMRWQQFTGPVMAKGLEDTALYVDNRLVSLNTVGGGGRAATPAEFHAFQLSRRDHWPAGMNATSTHDTKRSEDVQARIHVLSEVPELWRRALRRWSRSNRIFKTDLHGEPAPDRNDEILLYQTLLGAWPLDPAGMPEFPERIRQYLLKAVRESKRHSSWIDPDPEYEQALVRFAGQLLTPSGENRFLPDFLDFRWRLAAAGALNSLSQALLKIASPGVPDIYQGTGLWDFSLVDPDNRRPVDFGLRESYLREFARMAPSGSPTLARRLAGSWEDGRVKLYLTQRALVCRRADPGLFLKGEYVPLDLTGPLRDNALAFARHWQGRWAVAVVPRLVGRHYFQGEGLLRPEIWEDTRLELPPEAPRAWRNVFTGAATGPSIALKSVFQCFPVGLLTGGQGLQHLLDRNPRPAGS